MSVITTRIKKIREIKKIRQEDVAEKLHLSVKAYQKIENGITKLDIDRLAEIAKILEVSVTDLINADEGLYINQVSHNSQVGFSTKDVVFHSGEMGDSERKLFQKIVEDKDKEIEYLRDLLKKQK